MEICNGSQSGALNLSDPCIRAAWSALPPAAFVSFLLLSAVPRPALLSRALRRLAPPFQSFLTLAEAEAFEHGSDPHEELSCPNRAPFWTTFGLVTIPLLEAAMWLAIGGYRIIVLSPGADNVWYVAMALIEALSWTYAFLRPILNSGPTVPYDLLVLYTIQLFAAVLEFGGVFFDHHIDGVPLPATAVIIGHAANLGAVLGLLVIIFGMPMQVPSEWVEKDQIGLSISPEDYPSLWAWASFQWLVPLIKRGTYATLNEADVWALSPTMRSRPVLIKFTQTARKSLLRRLCAAHSLDLILDFSLTVVSVIFSYGGPFFLKRILDALDDPSPRNRAQSYIYAVLALCSSLLVAQGRVQHLWFARRASCQMRSELMAAIYDKALKRRDLSGIVKKAEKTEIEQTEQQKKDSDDPKPGADLGKIVNLMSGDADRIAMSVSSMHIAYGAPFEIIIAFLFLYQLLGLAAFAGFIALVLGWPLSSFITRRGIRIQKGVLASRDKRMGVLNELISAVKFIKFFAWEDQWIQRALDARKVELEWMVRSRVNSVQFWTLWTTTPILVSIISFFAYVVQGNQLTVGTAFTALALFAMVREPLNTLPSYIVQFLQTHVAIKRIETFLNEDEVSDQVSTLKRDRMNPVKGSHEAFGLKTASFRWNVLGDEAVKKVATKPVVGVGEQDPGVALGGDNRLFELRDINIIFPEGELTIVTGPTASGKTALLLALLGELTMLPGDGEIIMTKDTSKVYDDGLMHAISYAAQAPWLQHQSIKDNILFGFPYDEERYNQVVESCALRPDLETLEDGEETEIGARGVNLSGGQKARVALARAAYARTKYVLLDDPLSAVDSHTSRFLYERLFQGPLMRGRTVILVTHHFELMLPGAHYLVRMLDGRVDAQGALKDLRSRGLLDEITHDSSLEIHEASLAELSMSVGDKLEKAAMEAKKNAKKPRKLVQDEERETGTVKWSIYKTYLRASSYWTWVIMATLGITLQALKVSEKWWIKVWGESYGNGTDFSNARHLLTSAVTSDRQILMSESISGHYIEGQLSSLASASKVTVKMTFVQGHPLFYVGVYAAIGLTLAFMNVATVITQFTGALRASRILFTQLLNAVVRATMRWHDTTPTGRMLNRFSKDIETVDLSLASSIEGVNTCLANFLSSVIVIVIVFPFFIVPASILGYFYYRLSIGYLNGGRDLRRMESTSRSPIFSGFGELLEGIVTVRAFSAEQRFLDSHHKKIDLTTQMWYTFWMTNRWLLLNFQIVSAFAVFLTTLSAVSGVVSAGLAGLCITSAMSFTNDAYWACRFWTQLELDLNSVERVVEYLELPQEPPAVIEGSSLPAHWPSGADNSDLLVVEDLVVKYAPDLPAVLHGVSFALRGRERVGLLGRTGSGKSTLAMSIFRFVDPTRGKILVDGIDITTIGTHDLRSRLTFIPQDATLFSGNLRDNLDPFGEYSDSERLDALYRVQMLTESTYLSHKSSTQTSTQTSRTPSIHGVEPEPVGSPSGSVASKTATETEAKLTISLETQVSAGGANFSQGQRQLIALARALLRQTSIIVLDEATSSIDFATDAKIQKTIREEFNNSLLLTVAHRLHTVIDYDRLIVLDKGTIAEFDTPYNLIQKDGGVFRNMCVQSGTFAELEAEARLKMEQEVHRY